jgi:hypothetical protein
MHSDVFYGDKHFCCIEEQSEIVSLFNIMSSLYLLSAYICVIPVTCVISVVISRSPPVQAFLGFVFS